MHDNPRTSSGALAECKVADTGRCLATQSRLTFDSMLYLNFGQIMKIALILDTDKFEIDKDKETETWALSEITWDSSTTYTMAFWVPFEDIGVWTNPAIKEFASKLESNQIFVIQ